MKNLARAIAGVSAFAVGLVFFPSSHAGALDGVQEAVGCPLKNTRISAGVGQNPQAPNTWAATCSTMEIDRDRHSVTPLAFGQTLIAGGSHWVFDPSKPSWYEVAVDAAEVFDEHTGEFISTMGTLNVARTGHTATRLSSGKVLLVGGLPDYLSDGDAAHTSEIYSPITQSFGFGPAMVVPRAGGHAAILLPDGRVLISGGLDGLCYCATNLAEAYQPASNRFVPVGSMTMVRSGHTATVLADGKVLIAGGEVADGQITSSAELFNPATGTTTPVGNMTIGRVKHAAVRMADGRVSLGGGNSASIEIYNPATRTFAAAGPLSFTTNERPVAALLASGKIAFAHEYFVDVYNPATGTVSTSPPAYTPGDAFPEGGSGALLNDGLFLWSGGDAGTYPPAKLTSAYLYRPPN